MATQFKTAAPYLTDKMNLPVHDLAAAIPWYETVMGFQVVAHKDSPYKSAILRRDTVEIGLAENGGDPTQDGCFFEVENVAAAFEELKSRGLDKAEAGFQMNQHGETSYQVFFIVAPDGLCYCLGERQNS